MPSVSERQKRFMMAELGRAKAGKKTKTGMSASQLEDYKHVKKKAKSYMPEGGSLSPRGDIGELRQKEATKLGGFSAGKIVSASNRLPYRACREERDKYAVGK